MPTPIKPKRTKSTLLTVDRKSGYAMLLPAFLIIAIVTIFPILYSVKMSLSNISLTENGFQTTNAGLANYNVLIHNGEFWQSVWFTVYYALVTVVVELALGLLIAVAINNVQKMKSISLVVMLIPWALITVISAQMWDYIYNGVYGVLNYVLGGFHLIGAPVNWLGTPLTAVIAMMIADIWKTTPFVVIILLGGLQMIPDEYYEAAYLDGANRWQSFWRVTFPLLGGSIALAGLFRILQAFGVFDLPFVLTQGGPGTATQSLAMLGEKVLFGELHFGIGSAIAVSTVIFVLIVCLMFLWAFKNMVKGAEAE